MSQLFSSKAFIPNELSDEAAQIISKFRHPTVLDFIDSAGLGTDLLNYLNRPDLISEIFVQVAAKFNDYTDVLRLSVVFARNLSETQMERFGENIIGGKLLDRMASLILNMNPSVAVGMERNNHVKLIDVIAKLQLTYLTKKFAVNKPFAGDIMPNNTGISDRYGKGHDGIHIRSPKEGEGRVITVESLQGVVIRQYFQEVSYGTRIYGVWVLTKSGIVAVYKDLLNVNAELQKLTLGTLYLNPKNVPISKIEVSTGDQIGTTRPLKKEEKDNISDVGLHLTFIHLKHLRDFANFLKKSNNVSPKGKDKNKDNEIKPFPLEKLIAPCSDESPVRCL